MFPVLISFLSLRILLCFSYMNARKQSKVYFIFTVSFHFHHKTLKPYLLAQSRANRFKWLDLLDPSSDSDTKLQTTSQKHNFQSSLLISFPLMSSVYRRPAVPFIENETNFQLILNNLSKKSHALLPSLARVCVFVDADPIPRKRIKSSFTRTPSEGRGGKEDPPVLPEKNYHLVTSWAVKAKPELQTIPKKTHNLPVKTTPLKVCFGVFFSIKGSGISTSLTSRRRRCRLENAGDTQNQSRRKGLLGGGREWFSSPLFICPLAPPSW